MLITESRKDGLKMVSTKVLRKNMIENERKMRHCPKVEGPEEVLFRYRSITIR